MTYRLGKLALGVGELVNGPDMIASHAMNLRARLGAAIIAPGNPLVDQHIHSISTDFGDEAPLCRGAVSLAWQLSFTQSAGDAGAG